MYLSFSETRCAFFALLIETYGEGGGEWTFFSYFVPRAHTAYTTLWRSAGGTVVSGCVKTTPGGCGITRRNITPPPTTKWQRGIARTSRTLGVRRKIRNVVCLTQLKSSVELHSSWLFLIAQVGRWVHRVRSIFIWYVLCTRSVREEKTENNLVPGKICTVSVEHIDNFQLAWSFCNITTVTRKLLRR